MLYSFFSFTLGYKILEKYLQSLLRAIDYSFITILIIR